MDQMRSKSCLNSKITLYREVNHRIRYYTLQYYPTLFGEWLLVRSYGSLKNKRPTRVLKEYFSSFTDLDIFLTKLLKTKTNKGYKEDLSNCLV
jgi:predicted DNA-binding WGR domain protein